MKLGFGKLHQIMASHAADPVTLGGSLQQGKVALITGASAGIGAETARYFASLGCRLALTGRNMDSLQAVADECVGRGLDAHQILLIQAELVDEADVKKTAKQTLEKFNQIDVLVNNAGRASAENIENVAMETFDRTFALNLRAPLQLINILAPHLIKTKGSIVNVSSIYGVRSPEGALTYAMSKSALDHMTRCVAEELAPYGVRVNSVNPGVIHTNLFKRAGLTDEQSTQYLDYYSKTIHAMGRCGTVEEVARAIAFLASSNASFTTGETLLVDGGRHLLVRAVENQS